ncbi:hypothetical protein [Serratia sp. (in: enterobacteria)]|uniref:hypothetical protein n=1 Tax=Serratia sp. (in: enterobacteria) TaxID=616 RepID=UPI003F312853
MTTIAWDGKTLAADSQATAQDLVCSLHEQKIYTPGDGITWTVAGTPVIAIGCAGDCGAEFELQDKLTEGLTYATEFSAAFCFYAIAVIGQGRAYLIGKDNDATRATISLQVDPHALGSGSAVARAAMKCGKNAVEAVGVAIELDVYSGGNVQAYACTY